MSNSTPLYPEPDAFIGCAGWSVPKPFAEHFLAPGSHLERYATRFQGVEINSSFYRPHRPQTYAKWAASVPDTFRFAVKVPKSITHERRLKDVEELLSAFLGEVGELGHKLGPLLVQLPPSLRFDERVAESFFSHLRGCFSGAVVCEPRHASWFATRGEELLISYEVARVAADPAPVPQARHPGGWRGLTYYRWHGSPTIYRSRYSTDFLQQQAANWPKGPNKPTWCIFDNTADGFATGNALELIEILRSRGGKTPDEK